MFTPRRVTMRLRNNRTYPAAHFFPVEFSGCGQTAPAQSPNSNGGAGIGSTTAPPSTPSPTNGAPSSVPTNSQTPGPDQQTPPPPDQQQAPDQNQPPANDNGTFVFKAKSKNVILHATVVDDKNRLVTNLDKNAFTVFENNQPQTIISFRARRRSGGHGDRDR